MEPEYAEDDLMAEPGSARPEVVLSFLHPIEPLIHLPASRDSVCIDSHTECDRRAMLSEVNAVGLARLLQHPRASRSGAEGIADGIWASDGQRGVYLHREDYALSSDIDKTRWSVVASVDPRCCPLSPVVEVRRDEVEQAVAALRVSGVDPGGVAAVYRDENHYLEKLIDARGTVSPLSSLVGADEVRHRLWLLSEEEGEAVLNLLERCATAIISDAVVYRAMLTLRDLPGVESPAFPLVQFFHQRDFGVSFASTARVHGGFDGFDINHLVAELHREYQVTEFPLTRGVGFTDAFNTFLDSLRTEGITRRAIGVIVRGSSTAFIVAAAEDVEPSFGSSEIPEPARQFDAEWIQKGIVDKLFPAESRQPLLVLSDPRHATEALDVNGGQVAFLINPPPKRFIPGLAEERWRLPIGSLQLSPAPARGLVISRLPTAVGVLPPGTGS